MQSYPTYFNNGYANFMPYQPQQMPQYVDRMSQLQGMQQQLQPVQQHTPGLIGRIVENFDAITANDVPMDGNGAVFVKNDGSEIQIRNWTSQGTIATSRFKPVQNAQVDNSATAGETPAEKTYKELEGMFQKRFDELDGKLERLEKAIAKKVKREVVSDDE